MKKVIILMCVAAAVGLFSTWGLAEGEIKGYMINEYYSVFSHHNSDLEGRHLLQDRLMGPPEQAQALGRRLAEMLLDRGGDEILQEIYGRPLA